MHYVLSVKAEQCVGGICFVQTEVMCHKIMINEGNKVSHSDSPVVRIMWHLKYSK